MNNENPSIPSKTNNLAHSVTKTPAASSKQRRALGDISNRKQGGGGGGGKGLSVVPKKTPGLRLQPQQQRNPLTTKTPGLSKKKEVAFLPRPTTQIKQAPTVNILPDFGKSTTSQQPAQKSVLKNNSKTIVENDPVDDIERPAGRLWIEEPDDNSYTSISLPEIDWDAAYQKRQERRLKWEKEEEARENAAYNKYMENAFVEDKDGKYTLLVVF